MVQYPRTERKIHTERRETDMEENQSPAPETKGFFAKEKRPLLIAIAAAVVIVAVLLIVLIGNCGPKAAAENFARAVISCDIDRINKRCAFDAKELVTDAIKLFAVFSGDEDFDEEDFFEEAGDFLGEDIGSWKDLSKALKATLNEELEDHFGKYKVEIKATKVKELSAKKLKEEASKLPGDEFYDFIEYYDFDPDKVKSGAEVTLKIKINGKDDKETVTIPLYMAKIGGSWKFLMVGDVKDLGELEDIAESLF